MRIPVAVIDILAVAFMDSTLLFKMTPSFITRSSSFLLFFRTLVFSILFIVISGHAAN
jgi:hypothetical protein